MRLRALLLMTGIALSGCAGETGGGHWVTVDAETPANPAVSVPPGARPADAFREDNVTLRKVEVTWDPAAWTGGKLYDGFEVVVCPLDLDRKPARKLGDVEAVLYEFNVKTVDQKGREMMRWSVPAETLKQAWMDPGALGGEGGFHLRLAWAKRPTVDYMVLEVTFTTAGRDKFVVRKAPLSVDQPRYRWMLQGK